MPGTMRFHNKIKMAAILVILFSITIAFGANLPTFRLDLNTPPADRWREIATVYHEEIF